jgi:long-chain acyl-CoA synthetase
VGPPLPGTQVRTGPDGEIEVRGPTVFQGYWQDPASTKEAFDGPWLRTGDLGRTGDDGFVFVTGRKKELIVTAGGKNVAPGPIEDRVREHWLIAECVVIGDRRPYITALVTLDGDAFTRWKRQAGKPSDATVADLRDDPALRAVVAEAISRANTAVSAAESIKRFGVLPGTFEVGAELTPTQKVRRQFVLDEFADDADALYARPARQQVTHAGHGEHSLRLPEAHPAAAGSGSRRSTPAAMASASQARSCGRAEAGGRA